MKLFTVPVAASMLGVKQKTLRDWIWKRKIETVRNGTRYVRISEVAINSFVEGHTVPANVPMAPKRKTAMAVKAVEPLKVQHS
jgi:excisionase family DNA binding protein